MAVAGSGQRGVGVSDIAKAPSALQATVAAGGVVGGATGGGGGVASGGDHVTPTRTSAAGAVVTATAMMHRQTSHSTTQGVCVMVCLFVHDIQ